MNFTLYTITPNESWKGDCLVGAWMDEEWRGGGIGLGRRGLKYENMPQTNRNRICAAANILRRLEGRAVQAAMAKMVAVVMVGETKPRRGLEQSLRNGPTVSGCCSPASCRDRMINVYLRSSNSSGSSYPVASARGCVCAVERFTSDVSFGPGDDKIPTVANVEHLHPANRKRDDDDIIINILSVDERSARGGGGTMAVNRRSSMQSLFVFWDFTFRAMVSPVRSFVRSLFIYLFVFILGLFFSFEQREGLSNRPVIVFWHLIARPLIMRTQLRNIWHLRAHNIIRSSSCLGYMTSSCFKNKVRGFYSILLQSGHHTSCALRHLLILLLNRFFPKQSVNAYFLSQLNFLINSPLRY